MHSVLAGFKNFIMRGNVVELAVAIVIGAAFTALISSIVNGLFTPLIAAILGSTDLSTAGKFTINDAVFMPGLVLDGLIKFLVVAAAVYFVIVLPLNRLAERRNRGLEPAPVTVSQDIQLLQEIRDLLAAQQGTPPRP